MNDRASRRAPQAGDTELSGPPAAEAIAPQVLRETASWLLLMQEGPLAPAQQAELESWRSRSPEHQRAWRRAERLLANIGSLPPALARRALERPSGSGRRAVLRGLALLLGGAPLVWWGWRAQVWRDGFGADYLTAVGERRDLVLEDGSQVEMNTDSALDVRYDAGQRLLRLYRGEIYLRTAADRREPPRPFLVRTEQGLMRALGTAFSVRREGAETVLAVYEGAVQVRPEGAASAADGRVIEAGQRVRFDRQRIGPVESASEARAGLAPGPAGGRRHAAAAVGGRTDALRRREHRVRAVAGPASGLRHLSRRRPAAGPGDAGADPWPAPRAPRPTGADQALRGGAAAQPASNQTPAPAEASPARRTRGAAACGRKRTSA
ncbi:ferric-dicitrate binding protein FerR (iron transport regulator) [Pseudomonas aeruginosa]